jgi:putative hydrolase of the HAD superfamily
VCKEVFDFSTWCRSDAGEITTEEMKTAFCSRLPAELHEIACAVYDGWIGNMTPIDGMRDLILDIKRSGKPLYLLSNISTPFAETYTEYPMIAELFSHFDGLIFSGPLHLTKPDPRIFEHVLNTYHLTADECLFIDDSKLNVDGAEAVGIHGYLFDGDAARLRRYLEGASLL